MCQNSSVHTHLKVHLLIHTVQVMLQLLNGHGGCRSGATAPGAKWHFCLSLNISHNLRAVIGCEGQTLAISQVSEMAASAEQRRLKDCTSVQP